MTRTGRTGCAKLGRCRRGRGELEVALAQRPSDLALVHAAEDHRGLGETVIGLPKVVAQGDAAA
jgi:hypothetical protein